MKRLIVLLVGVVLLAGCADPVSRNNVKTGTLKSQEQESQVQKTEEKVSNSQEQDLHEPTADEMRKKPYMTKVIYSCRNQANFYYFAALDATNGYTGGGLEDYGKTLLLTDAEIAKAVQHYSDNQYLTTIVYDDSFANSFVGYCMRNPERYIPTYKRLEKAGFL
ncbi:hypothetical protein KKJ06_18385 [Xenorhabdus bovienii]|uniref:hypothetical protein n=1 Tax=Xenorhabdus bovienii TaxID=40576 RepID=UPI0023B2683B|nr:hypothetical protein [Xenorhabdus bovienii]MDE9536101.1 hypothetical protein [Xenorhabdus bovienii]MDE9552771.1 hypothetical protein [Xenorhabdus bovienii]MDE9557333.1 hypothetical protein [Xenorhabdus bovienii]MDE9589538.1 hypothetical protein [Xenorhabdus bovienii]